jgi:hypothetical protein
MAKQHSDTGSAGRNPQQVGVGNQNRGAGLLLWDHLDTLGDALKACRCAVAARSFTGDDSDQEAHDVYLMLEAIGKVVDGLYDPQSFGNELDNDHVVKAVRHLSGCLELIRSGVDSIHFDGDRDMPPAVRKPGVLRLLALVERAHQAVCSEVARLVVRH